MKKLHVVIILPTYNEADNIVKLVPILQGIFTKIDSYNCSILVVDDTSPDGTADQVRKLQKKFKNIELLTGEKEGLGAAYVRGMRYAISNMKADIMFEMDADLSHDPTLISKFLEKIEKGDDLVVGSRYIKGGSIPSNWPWYRKLFSVSANIFVRFVLMLPRVSEWTGGYRAVRSDVFLAVADGLEQYKGYTFQIAFLHRAVLEGYSIGEVPIHFIDRTWGESKIVPYKYIPNLVLYVVRKSTFIRYVITGFVGFGIDFGIAFMLVNVFFMRNIPLANALSAEIALVSNFIMNNSWSFKHKKIEGGAWMYIKKFIHFNIIAVGSVIIQFVGMWLAIGRFGTFPASLGLISIDSWILYKIFIIGFLVIPYSYLMYNKFVWTQNRKK